MASTLAPASVMENNEVFVELVWNSLYNSYWASADLDEDGEAVHFRDDVYDRDKPLYQALLERPPIPTMYALIKAFESN